jgi:hypothetical protein
MLSMLSMLSMLVPAVPERIIAVAITSPMLVGVGVGVGVGPPAGRLQLLQLLQKNPTATIACGAACTAAGTAAHARFLLLLLEAFHLNSHVLTCRRRSVGAHGRGLRPRHSLRIPSPTRGRVMGSRLEQ